MSCRSQSDEYKSALTDRFTDLIDPTPFDIQNAEVFEHQPLQDPSTELRYLYLLPKTHNVDHDGHTIARCQLHSDAEEQVPRYIGLSYTWGNPDLRRPILVGDKIFHATANLAIALEHLQDDKKTIIFWIDAICIDQSNLSEKSIQVQRMGNIFASAALVLAWLGPAADESELALRELSQQETSAFDLSTSAMVTQQEEARIMLSLDTVRQALDDKERWGHEDAERAVFDLSSGMSMFRTFNYDDRIWEGDLYESYKAFRGLEALPSDVADPRQWRREASRAYLKVLQEPSVKNLFVTAADIVGTSQDKVQPGDWKGAFIG
ncbi:hypothetical protein J4E83_006706 [Alternaria metachromatica]|uniref:uncharacterized protein n=1 Tax=Alternaria metachromatica TaxID=283354 RepID=UPI0020C341E5|nr:uncharacterized protein J4E83_006706 [Alternaria metachromatica]KAI4616036.1 hypothetical protein J4E83_006706 [Alternaria metachromatica]